MAEEAIGLAKSLSWTVETGPHFLNPLKEDLPEADSEAVSSTSLLPHKGRQIGPNNLSIEGEPLKNWDRVEVAGTGMEGYFYNGTLVLDLDEEHSDSASDDEGDEWTNPELRKNIAASSMIRIRKPSSYLFFGSGKVTFNSDPRDFSLYNPTSYHNFIHQHNPNPTSTKKYRKVIFT